MNSWEEVRAERDRLLAWSDWTQLRDSVCDKWAWKIYRFNLRNLPQKYATPEEVVFPEPPPAEQDASDMPVRDMR